MSVPHTYEYDCEKQDDGRVAGRATCECGWDGPWQHGTGRRHLRDYRAHIFAELGEELAYYEAPVICVNCEYRGPAKMLVGTDVWAGTCPGCGCNGRLRPEELHETRQRTGDPWAG